MPAMKGYGKVGKVSKKAASKKNPKREGEVAKDSLLGDKGSGGSSADRGTSQTKWESPSMKRPS